MLFLKKKRRFLAALSFVALLGVLVFATRIGAPSFKADILPTDSTPLLLADDASPMYLETGEWTTANRGFDGRERSAKAEKKAAKAQWKFQNLQPGQYEVWITWDTEKENAKNAAQKAQFVVRGTQQRTVAVDQRRSPVAAPDASNVFNGQPWQLLGTHEASDSMAVEVSAQANGRVYADAVLLRFVPPPSADISASTSVSSELAKPGSKITVFAAIRNNGPERSGDALLVATFPPGLRFTRKNIDARCSLNDTMTEARCKTGNLPNGEMKGFNFDAVISDDTECGMNLAALVSVNPGKVYDARPENNTAQSGFSVVCEALADAAVSMTVDEPTTSPNGRLAMYTLTLTNNGPDVISQDTEVRIEKLSDDLQDFRVYSGESTPGCRGDACTIPSSNLAPGQSASVTFIGTFDNAEADCGKTAITRVSLSPSPGQTADPLQANNEATTSVAVGCGENADVAVTMNAGQEVVPRAGDVRYEVKAENRGPDDAKNTQIVLHPGKGSWFKFNELDERCKRLGTSEYVICSADAVRAGESALFQISAAVSEWADCSVEVAAGANIRSVTWDRDHADDNTHEAPVRCE